MYDVIIVGGGPAGLSAALILGRCRRRVLVVDHGRPRNRLAAASHGYLTRDGVPPLELLRIAREELRHYPNVELLHLEATASERRGESFCVTLADGEQHECRALLLATGVIDERPDVPGLEELYGKSVHHCPYCDGWEWRDRPLAVYGRGKSAAGLASKLTNWSRDIVLCTDGDSELDDTQQAALDQLELKVDTRRVARLQGRDGMLEHVVFDDGSQLAREAMFICTYQVQGSTLPAMLGCEDFEKRSVPTGDREETRVAGLFVAGDASRDVQMVIVAASEGAQAAFAISKFLLAQELPAAVL